jgi:predicted permease
MTRQRPVAWSLRLFRALASAYPHEFRNIYGDEMVQMAEDAADPVWRRHGLRGLLRLLADVALRIPVEYATEFRQDLIYSARMLRASPGFTVVALVSLTLGIGVATAAFSDMNGFVLRDVPAVARPGELVAVKSPISYEAFRRYRDHPDLFTGAMTYLAPVAVGLSTGGRAERTWANAVSVSYFDVLGVRPLAGRFFERDDRAAIVISHRLWKDRFGGDPSAIGRSFRLNGHPWVLVGIAPEDFRGASPMVYGADLWLPLSADPAIVPELGGDILESRDRKVFRMVARLRPGVSSTLAESALEPIARRMEDEEDAPDRDRKGRRVILAQGGKLMPLETKDILPLASFFIVLGGLILLIACANVGNMMLARATARRKEIAMRLALGAGRPRLVRQLLVESLLLAVLSGAGGLVMATWLMRMASQVRMPYPMPIVADVMPDSRVLVFSLCLTLLCAIAFGLGPALRATRVDLTPALKESGSVQVGRGRSFQARNILMTAQMAASLTLLLITGFLVIGHRRMSTPSLGFDPSGLSVLCVDPVRDGYTPEKARAFFSLLADRVQRLPEVAAASLSTDVPMTLIGRPATPYVALDGAAKTVRSGRRYSVDWDFLDTMGIPVLRGRNFRKTDAADDSLVVIVNEKLARDSWPGQDPIGRRIELGDPGVPGFGFGAPKAGQMGRSRILEVIGIARDIRDGLVLNVADAPAMIYLPLAPAEFARPSLRGMMLVVRAAPGAEPMTAVRREIAAIDDRLTPFNQRTLADHVEEIMSLVRGASWTYTWIGVFGLILACVGMGGVTAYGVARRRREIGIRMAIGARRGDILRLVLREGMTIVSIGAVLGLLGARAGILLIGGLLQEFARTAGNTVSDPLLLTGATLLLGAVAMLACYLPARESSRIDPVEALRQE